MLAPLIVNVSRDIGDIATMTAELGSVVVRPFASADQAEAKELILSGLEEHWGQRDRSKNLDLENIGRSYAAAVFLVACDRERIVGTGALVPKSHGVAEIVRMSVVGDRRRQGLGRLILKNLMQYAQSRGIRTLVLETTETWHEVIQFYLAEGFRITHHAAGDVYFALDLSRANEEMASASG